MKIRVILIITALLLILALLFLVVSRKRKGSDNKLSTYEKVTIFITTAALLVDIVGIVFSSPTVVNENKSVHIDSIENNYGDIIIYQGSESASDSIVVDNAADFNLSIRHEGEKSWSPGVVANVGDIMEIQLEYINYSNRQMDDVMLRIVLPDNMEYVEDSTILYNSKYQTGDHVADNTITTTGINIGSYSNRGNAYVRFKALVCDNSLREGNNILYTWGASTTNGTVTKDSVVVMVNK